MDDEINQISESFSTITVEEVKKAFQEELKEFSATTMNELMQNIRFLIDKLIANMELYEAQLKIISQIEDVKKSQLQLKKMELRKELIYEDFFKLQNLINLFINQKIIMTYVHVDPQTGRREIRIFDNDISSLEAKIINQYGKTYAKLEYDVQDHFKQLKNLLPDEDNEGLQNVAAEVDARYKKYKGRILWRLNSEWLGYKLSNRGPINEAFVAFYLHEKKLENSLDSIHEFMTSANPQGVIYADNANGFLIGDISIGGLQFAVKGAYASPQGFKTVIDWLKKIKADNFSVQSFSEFITRFTEIEQEKSTYLVKEMHKRSITGMINYHQDNLLKPLTQIPGVSIVS